ncbi:MAG TPA: 7-carboxy-7-deazaguanine synthase QueE [Chromatiaceae bacterium]|jgi:7-carboxy-7-deazaguanine synthase|nr:7-carboxy-7-deazaguanine synthase QueE [Chromatiaceae bacterium]HIA07697.1 7-carboxy-7-deazaguanine synthase QueE [Chromatiaceae bacterium]HIB84327.1 7-carboxy-7-deazaguanine synthase QueE [Chromatiaceae bacterium]HIN82316.1 7-carboxy-7-deazaguanine synthase QueE [Chromatiales bacterium]HIO15183.1 7-carboxy-7-deazaguanine synthase QueE [Chromatiales bacterium]
MADESRVRITEIFYSLQGESRTVGLPTVFVRLTGCPLRCGYCDTSYAFTGGSSMALTDVLEQVASYGPAYVTVTGGEPLAQKSCLRLLTELCDVGYHVSLETSGAIDVSTVDSRVSKVMDLKTPDSGEQAKNLLSNVEHLHDHDQVKFVICSREDYDWAKSQLDQLGLAGRCEILFSPVVPDQNPTELADWILADRLSVRFQMQLHKQLWGDVAGK